MTTILLVDDEDLLREGVREILELSDYQVIEARDGEEALERARVLAWTLPCSQAPMTA